MIIVEGMDNTGKTTLITRLADDLKLLTISNKRLPTSDNSILEYTHHMAHTASHWPAIFDRWQAISERIYGPICRGVGYLTEFQAEALHELTTSITRPMVIYCRPADDTILRFGDRDQMEGVVDNAKQLIKAYDKEMEFVAKFIPVTSYDYESHTYESIKTIALEHLKGTIQ